MNDRMLNELVANIHSPIKNYIVPGLTSYLIGDSANMGKIRLFHMTHTQEGHITPHDHRFDFSCYVITGEVENTTYESVLSNEDGSLYDVTRLVKTDIGEYERERLWTAKYVETRMEYTQGDWYDMTADEFHSIRFERGAQVLFFEHKEQRTWSHILEPVVEHHRVPTFRVDDWMFKK